jgi:hypothetical protein
MPVADVDLVAEIGVVLALKKQSKIQNG